MKFIDLATQYRRIEQRLQARAQAVFAHGQFILGAEVRELETQLAQLAGVSHCIGAASGTMALKLALMAYGIGPGDEVITSSFSFFATAETIVELGATAVFVDINPLTYNIDASCIEAAITPRTKAIMTVDLYGLPAEYDQINAIAKQHGLIVIEDAAQAFGAHYNDRPAGSLADIACTSFYPVKPLGCYGDGGACFTDDAEVADRIRRLSNHGQISRYEHQEIGTTGRLDTLQAAYLLVKLEIFADECLARQQVAAWYAEALDAALPPFVGENKQSVWAQYTIRVQERDAFQAMMKSKNIPTTVHYPRAFTQIDVLKPLLAAHQPACPIAEKAAHEVVSLPFHPYLTQAEVLEVARHVNHFVCQSAVAT